jgi:hypothetical protein
MDSIIENNLRPGNFTSSQIYRLVGSAAVSKTYILEKNIERKLGLNLKQSIQTKQTAWGHFIELWVHEKKLGLTYSSSGKETFEHPTIPFWKGSPDFRCESKKIIAECKGYERKNFSIYADAIRDNSADSLRINCPEEYWQLVSNAIVLGYDKIQPIAFMPYYSEFSDIADFIDNIDDMEVQMNFKYIFDAITSGRAKTDLTYLPDNGYYENLTTCILDVPQNDIDFLTGRVLEAGKLLQPFYENKTIKQ